jgi:hypothetical protein
MDTIIIQSKKFERILGGLAELENSQGKLGVYNNEMTYVSWNFFQGLQRLYYGESCSKLIVFLKNTVNEYCFFTVLLQQTICQINNRELIMLRRENKQLISKWIAGLDNLQMIYLFKEDTVREIKNMKIQLSNCFT